MTEGYQRSKERAEGGQRSHWHTLPRPTKKIGTQAEKLLDYEVSGRHYALWLNLGSVCWQIKWRLWRFGWEFIYWRSYDP